MLTAADSPAAPAKPQDDAFPSTGGCDGTAGDYAKAFRHAPVGTLLMAAGAVPLQALRESEARFRSLTLLSASWYWEQDDQFRFVSFEGHPQEGRWQPDAAALGLCRWEIAGLRPVDGTWVRHRLDVQAHRAFRELECVRVRPGRPPVYVSISGEPVFDEHDRFTGYRGTTRDITAAKALETHLREAQGLLHMAARMGRLGVWSYVAGQERMTWSDELCRLCEVDIGFAPTLEQVTAFFAPGHRPLARSTLQRCLVAARDSTSRRRSRWPAAAPAGSG
ncbi:MAG: PAS domain-containing protein [Ramlibacter sp.]